MVLSHHSVGKKQTKKNEIKKDLWTNDKGEIAEGNCHQGWAKGKLTKW